MAAVHLRAAGGDEYVLCYLARLGPRETREPGESLVLGEFQNIIIRQSSLCWEEKVCISVLALQRPQPEHENLQPIVTGEVNTKARRLKQI